MAQDTAHEEQGTPLPPGAPQGVQLPQNTGEELQQSLQNTMVRGRQHIPWLGKQEVG